MQKLFIIIGFIFIFTGILLPWIQQMGIGHLPGDIFVQYGNTSFYFPLATCILASLILTLLIRLLTK